MLSELQSFVISIRIQFAQQTKQIRPYKKILTSYGQKLGIFDHFFVINFIVDFDRNYVVSFWPFYEILIKNRKGKFMLVYSIRFNFMSSTRLMKKIFNNHCYVSRNWLRILILVAKLLKTTVLVSKCSISNLKFKIVVARLAANQPFYPENSKFVTFAPLLLKILNIGFKIASLHFKNFKNFSLQYWFSISLYQIS
jgi:hypothetical protein